MAESSITRMTRRPARAWKIGSFQANISSPSPRYVCLQCRHRAAHRQSTLTRQLPLPIKTPSQCRTYATESGIADRVGWHKKFTDVMNKRMWKEGEAPPSPYDQNPQEPGTEVQRQPQQPRQEPTTVVDDAEYTPAVSGEGLEMIGGPSGWWEEAWDEQHRFQGFMPPTPVREPAKIRAAIERALVEAITLYQGPRRIRRIMMKNRVRPVEEPTIGDFNLFQAEDGAITLQWRRQEDGAKLREYLCTHTSEVQESQQLEQVVEEIPAEDENVAGLDKDLLSEPDNGASMTSSIDPAVEIDHRQAEEDKRLLEGLEDDLKQTSTTQFLPDEELLGLPSSTSKSTETKDLGEGQGNNIQMTATRPLESEEPMLAQAKEPIKEQYSGLQKSITLTDPELKFSVIKRVMQLTGKRIPDPAIQAIKSSHDIFYELIQKPKPKKLADILERGVKKTTPSLKALPNVRIVPYRQKPYMAESALGSKKVIERRLEEHGIQEPFRDAMESIESYERNRLLSKRGALIEADAVLDTMEEDMEQDAQEQSAVEQNAMQQVQVNEQRSVLGR